tara:strand:- start:3189 stop:3989 length:801 start_codon:yes stop_codon:yes gene_type:complete
MYSYQHRYHAGNFADIHKHVTLLAILKYLHNKESACCIIDAFAGEGIYNLNSKESDFNQEYKTGYSLLKDLSEKNFLYEELLQKTTENIYSGSPYVIQSELRSQDRAIFIENHTKTHALLVDNFKEISRHKNIKIYKRDSYEAVNALVPYKEPRGIIFFDPSYEVKTEYHKLANFVYNNYKKNPQGIYVIWYPIIFQKSFHKELFWLFDKFPKDKIWHNQIFHKKNEVKKGMYGSGIIVINIPWTVDTILDEHFHSLNEKSNPTQS